MRTVSLPPDLTACCAGILSPNPFWLASAPPTNTGAQVMRAFEAGWGGAVWKTIGQDPAVVNTTSRYSSIDWNGTRMMGFNNIELISDRSVEDNLREIREVKRLFPKQALVVSLMVPCERKAWHDMVRRVEDTGCDGLELNFGCPHGMNERGMGSAVGQVPEYCRMVVEYVKEVARTPVLVKLTPNITDIREPALASQRGGADGISLINTLNSVTGVDLDTLVPRPQVAGRSTHGGYCGPAVKPIALHMVSAIAGHPEMRGLPISGIGGISTWRDAVEFLLLGARTVQVCTAVMHHGFRIVEDMIDGLSNWMREKGYTRLDDLIGRSLPYLTAWKHLDLNYQLTARINPATCIGCDLCHVACMDGAHQCIHIDPSGRTRVPTVDEAHCVGCNLCSLVCPVDGCIRMVEVANGRPAQSWEDRARTGPR